MRLRLRNVTTAASIDGWQIDAHHGVVAAHVVAGASVISEFFASFTDVFGGRSGSYQNQLESLYTDAIGKLAAKAEALGANWIVGLSVDVDEVSGKGMQMFMITALGTAVSARPRSTAAPETRAETRPELRPAEGGTAFGEVEAYVRRQRLLRRLADLPIRDEDWPLLIEGRMAEAAPHVLTWIERTLVFPPARWSPEDRQRILGYLRALAPELASSLVHGAARGTPTVATAALHLITEAGLGNLREAHKLLDDPAPVVRRRALTALAAEQSSYRLSDVDTIDAILESLAGAFPDRARWFEESLFRGPPRKRWECGECRTVNDADLRHCSKCERDPRGLHVAQPMPESIRQLLLDRREAILAVLAPQDVDAPQDRASAAAEGASSSVADDRVAQEATRPPRE